MGMLVPPGLTQAYTHAGTGGGLFIQRRRGDSRFTSGSRTTAICA